MMRAAWSAVIRRWRSTAFSVGAVAVGLLAVVATLGIAQSAAHNVALTLRALSGTTAEARLADASWGNDSLLDHRLTQVSGVQAGGTMSFLPTEVTAGLSVRSARGDGTGSVRIVIASQAGLAAREVAMVSGVIPTDTAVQRDSDQVVVGSAAAARLAVAPQPGLDRLEVGGREMMVSGVVSETAATSALDNAVLMSPATARMLGLLPDQQSVFIRHDGTLDVDGLALAVSPERPEDVTVELSAAPGALQAQISEDTAGLVAVLTGVTIVASGIGVANTMMTAVWQRRSEIGIRRAIGATRARVGGMFLVEAALIGLLGGLVGTVFGVLAGAAVARFQGWAYALPPLALLAPIVGLAVGMVFGAIPAFRAASVDPAELLRSP